MKNGGSLRDGTKVLCFPLEKLWKIKFANVKFLMHFLLQKIWLEHFALKRNVSETESTLASSNGMMLRQAKFCCPFSFREYDCFDL